MKRQREERVELVNDDPWEFMVSGVRVPLDVLLRGKYKGGFIALLRRFTHEQLRLLQRASKSANEFVAREQIWKYLVERDYPEQFQVVYDQDLRDVRQLSKSRIDKLSKKPGNNDTYWKRYYEFLTKIKRKPYKHGLVTSQNRIDSDSGVKFFLTNDPNTPVLAQIEQVSFTSDVRRIYYIAVREWKIDVSNTIPKSQFDAFENKTIFTPTQKGVIFIDDGLIAFFEVTDRFVELSQVFYLDPLLVSTCVTCDKPTSIMCSCCETPFCDQACQRINH